MERLERRMRTARKQWQSDRDAVRNRLEHLALEREALAEELRLAESRTALQGAAEARARKLLENGLLAAAGFEQARQATLAAAQTASRNRRALAGNGRQSAEGREALIRLEGEHQALQLQFQQERADPARQLSRLAEQRQTAVVAPKSGVVTFAQFTVGDWVRAEQVLMTVYPNSNMNVREGQELQKHREGEGRVFFAGPTLWHGMLINTKAEPFNDVRVRRALNLILHRQAFNEIFGAGEYLIGSPLPPDQWFGRTSEEWSQWPGLRQTGDGQKHPEDIAEAQRLMAEAGYADGFETSILAANFLSFPDMAQVAADQMERWLGIEATVQPEEPAAGYVRYEAGDWKLGFHGNGILVMDPDQLVAGSYLSKATRNYSAWEPEKVRELYEAQLRETDIQKRRDLVLELGDYLANEDTHVVITTWAMLVPYVDNSIRNYNVASGFANHTNKEHLWHEE